MSSSLVLELTLLVWGPVHWTSQATCTSALETNVNDTFFLVIWLNYVLDAIHSLLSCVNLVVLPVVLTHQFGVRIQTGPLRSVLQQNLLDISIMHSGPFLTLFDSRIRFCLVLLVESSATWAERVRWCSMETVAHSLIPLGLYLFHFDNWIWLLNSWHQSVPILRHNWKVGSVYSFIAVNRDGAIR